jgi:hypothetical protein
MILDRQHADGGGVQEEISKKTNGMMMSSKGSKSLETVSFLILWERYAKL